ncbi:hypothetical protein T8J41_02750 [Nitratireductor rhodophyticola]|uniref:hypothetical protein n=1 Tax=Nitratireductor rhodophyticola TaxID=2854036 RepID=UPI002AC93FA5|nr:hypothetical protein [Nitratireductor rhodophyticola]WPZ14762.1 hypothetical protein T8J41_02750 [Nitratireductor rhodophyticola]
MPTNFASVQTHLERAQAELTGTDPATQQLREAIGLLMDAALKAEFSAKPQVCEIIPFPRAETGRPARTSHHG